jgi:enoyl-CoA hydratase/carnithine racemase
MGEDRIAVDTGTGELLCEVRDRVALITLNRPEARNALSDQLTPRAPAHDQAVRR